MVKHSNPCLLGYLFPTLYPRGPGFYSLDYDGVKRENIDQIEVYDGRYVKVVIQKACSVDKKSTLTKVYLSNIQKAWVAPSMITSRARTPTQGVIDQFVFVSALKHFALIECMNVSMVSAGIGKVQKHMRVHSRGLKDEHQPMDSQHDHTERLLSVFLFRT